MKIEALRENHNLTQQALAELVGVSRQMISAIESGERRPSVETAKKIAKVLKVDWTIFFENNKSPGEPGG